VRLTKYLKEDKELSKHELDELETYADRLFSKVGIDVEFTRHFIERANDKRNKEQIRYSELVSLFRKTFKKYGKKIPKLGDGAQAVIEDMKSDINMPFVLNWDEKSQEFDLVAKTVMRKKNFKTGNKELRV